MAVGRIESKEIHTCHLHKIQLQIDIKPEHKSSYAESDRREGEK